MGVKIGQRKGDKAWWVFINHRGQRKARKVGDKDAAKAVARKAQEALAAGTLQLDRPDVPLFKDYAVTWLQQHRQVNAIKESTGEEYEKAIRLYLLPTFGDRPLTGIDRASVKTFITRLRESGSAKHPGQPLSGAAVRGALSPLRLILEDALDNGLIQANPAARVGKWNRRKTEREAEGCDPFTSEELEAIAKAALEHVPVLWPLVGVWAQGGPREGEVFGLQWRDLDLEKGTAIVRRTYTRGRLGSPKTGRSRTVNLTHPLLEHPEAALEALRALRSVREAEAAVAGRDLDPESFVFTWRDGHPFRSERLHRAWRRCLALAGVRYRNPEQLRHTFASTLLSRGWSLLYVQAQGGWADANTLLKHYSRWIPQGTSHPQPAATPAQLSP